MTTLPRMLTARQRDVLTFLRLFFEENDQLPPMHVIAARFGWKSDNSAQCYVDILEKKGYVERNSVGKYRFVREERKSGDTEPMSAELMFEMERDGIRVQRYRGAASCS